MLCGRSYSYLFDKGAGKPKVWLYAELGQEESSGVRLSRTDLLQNIGDFSKVPVAKLGDRISLAFTQTIPITELSIDQIVGIPEVVRNGYIFSDGCGIMGRDIAKAIQREFGLNDPDLPGIVQIRLGGVKGMLSLVDEFPPGEAWPADKIGLRPSMVKFASNHRILEVKKTGEANYGADNKLFKEAIIIMGGLGVPQNVFLDIAGKSLDGMNLTDVKEARRKMSLRCSLAIFQGVIGEFERSNVKLTVCSSSAVSCSGFSHFLFVLSNSR